MNEVDFKKVVSRTNLELAWRRVTTARKNQYKRYFRETFYIYELGVERNLDDLHQRLIGASYQPKAPARIFVPKKSGLQRGISLLHIEDQIVYQAIVNVVAEKVRYKRERLLGRSVFSNQVSAPTDNIFFLKNWRIGYIQYTDALKTIYRRGYRWVAQFDLAAFYDTISHELLLKTAFPGLRGSPAWETLKAWLEKWANTRENWPLSHGIPQGPISSDFLAEVFLLPIDKSMSERHRYIRYVDDIRLFGKTEIEVQRAVRELEMLCRERGLIPQGQKFGIEEASSIKDAFGALPSIGDSDDDSEATMEINVAEAEEIFSRALEGRPKRILDKSHARYILYRGARSPKIRKWVLDLIPRHPEHIEAFLYYLRDCRNSKKLFSTCSDYAIKTPYDFVTGEILRFFSNRVTAAQARRLLDKALEVSKDKMAGVSAKSGALIFLCRCEALGLGNYSRFVFNQPLLVQSLAIPALPVAKLSDKLARQFIRPEAVEPALVFCARIVSEQISLVGTGMDFKNAPSQAQNVLAALGFLPQAPQATDPIAEVLNRHYGCGNQKIWRALFKTEYGHAVQHLRRAQALFDMSRSEWLSYQNSFNHALFLSLQNHLNSLCLPGACKTVSGGSGELVNFGTMLQISHPFTKAYLNIGNAFRAANERRNRLPGSHPYDKKTRTRNKHLAKNERTQLVSLLRVAYREIVQLCLSHGIRN